MVKVKPLGFETLRGGENKRSGERGKRRRKESERRKRDGILIKDTLESLH